jgi:hypothetical protein
MIKELEKTVENIQEFFNYHKFKGWDFTAINITGVVQMGDYYFNIQDILYFWENKTDWKVIAAWYDYCLEFGNIDKEKYLNFWYASPEKITIENFNEHLKKKYDNIRNCYDSSCITCPGVLGSVFSF